MGKVERIVRKNMARQLAEVTTRHGEKPSRQYKAELKMKERQAIRRWRNRDLEDESQK